MKLRLIIILLSLLIGSPAFGAAAHDATSTSSCTGCSSDSWTHTPVGSSDLGLIGSVHLANSSETVSSFTHNSLALSIVGSPVVSPGSSFSIEVWKRAAPSSGAQTCAYTATGATNIVGTCTTITGAHQSGLVGTEATSSVTDTSTTQDVTVPANGLALDFYSVTNSGGNCPGPSGTAGAGQTELFDLCSDNIAAYGSYSTGSGTNTMSYSWAVVANAASMAVPINEAAAAGGASRRIMVIQ
jgi:hypothetical protein